MQSKVEKIVPAEGNASVAGGVVVNGQTIPADFVIMAVAPATEFLQGTSIKLEKDGGIMVDEYLKVKDVKDVYAIGEGFAAVSPHYSSKFVIMQAISHTTLTLRLANMSELNIGMCVFHLFSI
jgi:NAD(P)H-nitrite reductase large subunit